VKNVIDQGHINTFFCHSVQIITDHCLDVIQPLFSGGTLYRPDGKWLDVHRIDTPGRADPPRRGQGKTTGTTPEIHYGHSSPYTGSPNDFGRRSNHIAQTDYP